MLSREPPPRKLSKSHFVPRHGEIGTTLALPVKPFTSRSAADFSGV